MSVSHLPVAARAVLRGTRPAALTSGFFEQLHDLLVRGLIEVLVPEAYGPEVWGSGQADQLVHPGSKKVCRLGRAHGCGQDQALRLSQPEGFDGGTGRHACSEAVVDQDRCPSHDLRFRPPTPKKAQPPLYLGDFAGRDPLYVLVGDAETPDNVGVQDANAAGSHSPDAELGLARRPELSRDEHVERRPEGT